MNNNQYNITTSREKIIEYLIDGYMQDDSYTKSEGHRYYIEDNLETNDDLRAFFFAIQRAVMEAENALIAKYQNMEDELEQLRIELERIQKYVVHKRDCDIVTYKTVFGGMNPKKIDCTCGLEGGGDDIFNYWKQRCLLAERYLEESPCDPDITIEQHKAWNAYIEFINQNKK